MLDKKAKKAIKTDLKAKEKRNLEIRDTLALERTNLANERTLLAYSRTAMALILAGLTFMKLFDDPLYFGIGMIFIPLGLAFGWYGYRRYTKKQVQIDSHTESYTPTSHVHAQVAEQEKAKANLP
ncbi:DUF202 domain-containing protein [Pontibacter chitinilyticus]|uniref:DUF202 domain-containing protein n=1 Tax=Pontibacter chitinilyticus TaxID=2674989 RepID=UPI00321B2A15